jgi:MarR family 2-MHQ and catechol resistance regulon transcriptional repressor
MGTDHDRTAHEKLALDTYIKLWRAANAVDSAVNEHLGDFDLTTSQFGVLEALYHLGPLQPGELGTKILKTSGNMTLVIDNLVKRGLVRRQRREDDRRCIDVYLTDTGSALVERIWPGHAAGIVAAFDVLSAAEQQQLARLCRTLGLAQRRDEGDEY